ncbi:MAG: nucleoside triphosphate pyrophosphohydrolase [Acidobacteria bacterium]|nr:nucleoside triphosphate pyrophosphohydrolase [Acidobacteriota bacterium]
MNSHRFEDLVKLMARLRAPDGCPWDRQQTPRSLRTYLLEETYEVLDAIERDDPAALRDELGDLLLQIVFLAQIAREDKRFTIDDVVGELHEKLVRRHPHVFGTQQAETPEQVVKNWEALKAEEREQKNRDAGAEHRFATEGKGLLSDVPRTLPALLEAYQLTRRAAQVGFDWSKLDDLLAKLTEEVGELRQALAAQAEPKRLEDEVGDLLFVAVNIARYLKIDPEVALRRTNRKFIARFRQIEEALEQRGKSWEQTSLEEMDALWEASKQREPRG